MLFLGALALGVAVRAVDYLNCRSLGLDEARLAVNVASRSFLGLLQPLDLDQSAPPLFLWGERLAWLAPWLTLDEVRACVTAIVRTLGRTADSKATFPLHEALRVLAPRLTPPERLGLTEAAASV